MEKGQFAKPTDADKAWFESLLPDHPEVSRKPMFGNLAGFAAGNMFLALFGSTVAVRLDEASRQELLAEDGAVSFEPMPGRAMKEYVTLPNHWRKADLDQAQRWVDRSLAYALTLPPKKSK